MNIKCNSCQTVLKIDENRYTQDSVVIQCPNCSQKLRVQIPQNPVIINQTYTLNKKLMSMFNQPFSFEGRIRRSEYAISSFIFFIIFSIAKAFMDPENHVDGIEVIIVPFFIVGGWFMAAQSAKRCHDLGKVDGIN